MCIVNEKVLRNVLVCLRGRWMGTTNAPYALCSGFIRCIVLGKRVGKAWQIISFSFCVYCAEDVWDFIFLSAIKCVSYNGEESTLLSVIQHLCWIYSKVSFTYYVLRNTNNIKNFCKSGFSLVLQYDRHRWIFYFMIIIATKINMWISNRTASTQN